MIYVYATLGVLLAALTVVGTIQLLTVSLAGILPQPKRRKPAADRRLGVRLAIVVPAHDEAEGIARTIASLRASAAAADGGDSSTEVVVIADNCTDDTAALAERSGARVLVRQDAEHRGKGYALDHAFGILLGEGVEACSVVDADTLVDEHFCAALHEAFAAGCDAVQTRYVTLPPTSTRQRLVHIAFLGINVLRPRGRQRLGVSVGILGNGFALSRATLEAVPYEARSIVEDLEYHVRLVRAGKRVEWLDHATVHGEMPDSGAGTEAQRARWEGGRFRIVVDAVPALIGDVLRGRLRLIEPLFDLLLLPLAYHVVLLLACLLVPYAPTRWYALGGLGVVAFHVLAAVRVGRGGWKDLGALATAPFYVLWKLGIAKTILRSARRDTNWVRTAREGETG